MNIAYYGALMNFIELPDLCNVKVPLGKFTMPGVQIEYPDFHGAKKDLYPFYWKLCKSQGIGRELYYELMAHILCCYIRISEIPVTVNDNHYVS